MKHPVLATLALTLFATPVLAEGHDGKGAHGPNRFFEKVDADKDGKVSKAEWTAKGDKMFADSDTNKDGFISKDEAKAAHEARKAKWKERKAEYMKRQAETKAQ